MEAYYTQAFKDEWTSTILSVSTVLGARCGGARGRESDWETETRSGEEGGTIQAQRTFEGASKKLYDTHAAYKGAIGGAQKVLSCMQGGIQFC